MIAYSIEIRLRKRMIEVLDFKLRGILYASRKIVKSPVHHFFDL